jgi:hypothetical protein
MKTYERHPLSAAWPDMARDDFDALVCSIGCNGLREPITLMDGQILDGWHRYQACESAGVAGSFVTFGGTIEAAEALVNDRHTRRSLTASQRAMAVLKMYEWRTGAGRPKKNSVPNTELTVADIAKRAHVSTGTIDKVKTALAKSPERAAEIKAGTVSASTVIRDAKPKAAKPEAPPIALAGSDERDARIAQLEEQIQELAKNLQECNDDNASMARVFDANDQVAAALAEAKRFREQVRVLTERNNGLMNEKNAALAQAKSWMNKFQRAEKQLKTIEAESAF